MSTSSMGAASYAVKQIVDNFQFKLQAKQAAKKLPSHIHDLVTNDVDKTLFLGNLPKPSSKIDCTLKEDPMIVEPPCQNALNFCVPPLSNRKHAHLLTNNSRNQPKRNISTRYGSTAGKQRTNQRIKFDLVQLKEQGLVQVESKSQPPTAKSYRSAIEIDNQIKAMRSQYLQNLKERAKFEMSMTQQLSKNVKRIPREFTFDLTGEILEKHPYNSKKTVFSPLKTKSISSQQIHKKVKKISNNPQQEENLQEILRRADTKSGERKKRQFNNYCKRQISHVPFICLAENTKLIENSYTLRDESPMLSKFASRENMRSTFSHFIKEKTKKPQLFSSQEQYVRIPNNFQPTQMISTKNQHSILKNSRFWVRQIKKEPEPQVTDFNPINVTRDYGIDKYYKLERSAQFSCH